MRNFFTILLLAVHFFNLAGHSMLFRYLLQNSSEKAVQRIENGHYSDEELVLVKVPVLLPYSTNWKEYERYDGEIEWNGVHYNYVKRKIQNDTLYLLCLPDKDRSKLQDAQFAYAKQVNDTPAGPEKGSAKQVKKLFFEKECVRRDHSYAINKLMQPNRSVYNDYSSALVQEYADCLIQPPDLLLI